MKVLVSEKLSEHKYKTPEGYLICTDAILARTGKQSYTKDELFQDGDDTEVNVDRPYDEVMNAKTIASFENKPITFDHPDEDVNVGNYKDYAIGYVRDVHQGKTDKGEDVILGNLVITDQEAINAIEQGDHTDLSCGYDCDIRDDGNGNYSQTNIRGNHLALCEQGRAGIAHIVDSKVKDDLYSRVERAMNQIPQEFDYDIKRDGNKVKVIAYSVSEVEDIMDAFSDMGFDCKYNTSRTFYIVDSKVKDDNLLGKRVRIRKRYSNLDGTIGTIYSYEGTNYDDEVEVKRNGHIYKVNYEDIEFLDSKVKDFNYSKKEIEEAAMKLLKQKPFLTYEEALQKVKENIKNGNYLLDNKIEDAEYAYKLTKKKNDYDEYVIQAYKNGKKNEDATYYTDDWDDAINTLKSIAKQEKLAFRQQGSVFIADNKAKAFNDSKEMTMSDAIKMLNIVDAYKKVRDVKDAISKADLKRGIDIAEDKHGYFDFSQLKEEIEKTAKRQFSTRELYEALKQNGLLNAYINRLFGNTKDEKSIKDADVNFLIKGKKVKTNIYNKKQLSLSDILNLGHKYKIKAEQMFRGSNNDFWLITDITNKDNLFKMMYELNPALSSYNLNSIFENALKK